jgi:hypothetical protein
MRPRTQKKHLPDTHGLSQTHMPHPPSHPPQPCGAVGKQARSGVHGVQSAISPGLSCVHRRSPRLPNRPSPPPRSARRRLAEWHGAVIPSCVPRRASNWQSGAGAAGQAGVPGESPPWGRPPQVAVAVEGWVSRVGEAHRAATRRRSALDAHPATAKIKRKGRPDPRYHGPGPPRPPPRPPPRTRPKAGAPASASASASVVSVVPASHLSRDGRRFGGESLVRSAVFGTVSFPLTGTGAHAHRHPAGRWVTTPIHRRPPPSCTAGPAARQAVFLTHNLG